MAAQQDLTEDYMRAIERIDELGKLPVGWNSHRADPIDKYARERAKQLVLSLSYRHPGPPPPRVAPTPNAGVLLHWDIRDLEVEIVFNPVGGIYSVARADNPEFLVYGDDLGAIDVFKTIVEPYLCLR